MSLPFLDLRAQYAALRDEIREAVDAVLDSQACIGGAEVDALEAELSSYLQAPFAVACSNGSDAIVLALRAAGIGPGDEVIVPTFTFFATAGSVRLVGATPIFADIDPATFNIDPAHAASLISPKTRAIIPVDLFGQPANISAILALAKSHDLTVIEDSAQAIGAEHRDQRVGGIAPLTTFSFYPTKNLGACGEGGLVTTTSEEHAQLLKQLRNHGQSDRYRHETVGMNARLDAIQCAILRVKLRHLDSWTEARQAHAARYRERLVDLSPRLTLPAIADDTSRHVYNQFVIRLQDRDAVRAALTEAGIGCGVYYPLCLHLQPCFAELGGQPGQLPEAQRATAEVLALPIYPELSRADIDVVCDALIAHLSS